MNVSAMSADQGVPSGSASPDEPAHTLPAEPSHATQVSDSSGREEPAFALEPDLPTDGRDEVGEAMIRDLPQRPELSEPPSQPDTSHQKP